MKKKIGVMMVGAKGSVATTLLAAQAAMRKGLNIQFLVPSNAEEAYRGLGLIEQEDIAYGGWDIVPDSFSDSCAMHRVVPPHILPEISVLMDEARSYPAILVDRDQAIDELLASEKVPARMKDIEYSTTIFSKRPLNELVQSLTYDIEDFRKENDVTNVIVVNIASTEPLALLGEVHQTLDAFEKGLKDNAPNISTGMIYAYAAFKNHCHFINFTPSICADVPALEAYAVKQKVLSAGKDGKTGQTLYKTVLAPMLKYRGLKLTGWYSTNILGNRDGQILNHPEHAASKIGSKKAVLSSIMGYDDFDHQVHIHYYRPRGDSKEAWDNVDFRGWFDVPMQMKIDWLGDDSILASPLMFDLIRWVQFFASKGEVGVLPQLSSYFKSPLGTKECDFFKQLDMLRQHVAKHYL